MSHLRRLRYRVDGTWRRQSRDETLLARRRVAKRRAAAKAARKARRATR